MALLFMVSVFFKVSQDSSLPERNSNHAKVENHQMVESHAILHRYLPKVHPMLFIYIIGLIEVVTNQPMPNQV